MQGYKLLDNFAVESSTQLSSLLDAASISHTSKQLGNSIHIRSPEHGFQVQFVQGGPAGDRVETVFLYINNPKNKQYCHYLPYGLCDSMSIKAIVLALGEPTSKSKYEIECEWSHLGIAISFFGQSWKDQSLKINTVCLFAVPEGSPKHCGSCIKPIPTTAGNLSCGNCRHVHYCSQGCRDKTYVFHRMYCLDVD